MFISTASYPHSLYLISRTNSLISLLKDYNNVFFVYRPYPLGFAYFQIEFIFLISKILILLISLFLDHIHPVFLYFQIEFNVLITKRYEHCFLCFHIISAFSFSYFQNPDLILDLINKRL